MPLQDAPGGVKSGRKPGQTYQENGVWYVVAQNGQSYPIPPPNNDPAAPPPPGFGRMPDGSLFYIGGDKPWFMVDGKWVQDGQPGTPSSTTGTTRGESGIDWSTYFGYWGLPREAIEVIDKIFRDNPDPGTAAAMALAYIRGTDWYRQTYPGIQEGMRTGIIRDEADYRSYLNQTNFYARQYLGRDIGADEIAALLREGATPDVYGKRLGGAAYVRAYGNDLQYLAGAFGEGRLDANQLQKFGEQRMGLGSGLGMILEQSLEQASGRLRRIFEGVLAQPSLSMSGGRLAQGAKPPDVST